MIQLGYLTLEFHGGDILFETFIANHLIVSIGYSTNPKILYAEIIVDNPVELIQMTANSIYYISHIRFYHRVQTSKGSSIGYGGPRDPRDSLFYFAETDLEKHFEKNTPYDQYLNFFYNTKKMYPEYQLTPSFEISVFN